MKTFFLSLILALGIAGFSLVFGVAADSIAHADKPLKLECTGSNIMYVVNLTCKEVP